MATNYAICLVGAMDRLWFHQIVLFSEPTSLLLPKTQKISLSISEPLTYPSPNNISQQPLVPQEETPSVASSVITSSQDDQNNDEDNEDIEVKERPTSLNHITRNTPSPSPSPSTQKHSRKFRYSGSVTRLQKTMSCKNLQELELLEVQGFIDLGFIFKKENISPQMMNLVPGLQRLEGCKNEHKNLIINSNEVAKDDEFEDDEEEEEGEMGVMRPYLSEAWITNRHDSPLINLGIPRITAAADMKKRLRYWARTVASIIQQEF